MSSVEKPPKRKRTVRGKGTGPSSTTSEFQNGQGKQIWPRLLLACPPPEALLKNASGQAQASQSSGDPIHWEVSRMHVYLAIDEKVKHFRTGWDGKLCAPGKKLAYRGKTPKDAAATVPEAPAKFLLVPYELKSPPTKPDHPDLGKPSKLVQDANVSPVVCPEWKQAEVPCLVVDAASLPSFRHLTDLSYGDLVLLRTSPHPDLAKYKPALERGRGWTQEESKGLDVSLEKAKGLKAGHCSINLPPGESTPLISADLDKSFRRNALFATRTMDDKQESKRPADEVPSNGGGSKTSTEEEAQAITIDLDLYALPVAEVKTRADDSFGAIPEIDFGKLEGEVRELLERMDNDFAKAAESMVLETDKLKKGQPNYDGKFRERYLNQWSAGMEGVRAKLAERLQKIHLESLSRWFFVGFGTTESRRIFNALDQALVYRTAEIRSEAWDYLMEGKKSGRTLLGHVVHFATANDSFSGELQAKHIYSQIAEWLNTLTSFERRLLRYAEARVIGFTSPAGDKAMNAALRKQRAKNAAMALYPLLMVLRGESYSDSFLRANDVLPAGEQKGFPATIRYAAAPEGDYPTTRLNAQAADFGLDVMVEINKGVKEWQPHSPNDDPRDRIALILLAIDHDKLPDNLKPKRYSQIVGQQIVTRSAAPIHAYHVVYDRPNLGVSVVVVIPGEFVAVP